MSMADLRRALRNGRILVAFGGAIGLAACNTGPGGSTSLSPSATPTVQVTVTELEGKWGLASYRSDADRPRTEAEAKSACGNPYVIGHGTSGGVIMHLADQTQPTELFLKVAGDGRTFLGPRGPAGVKQDRLIVSFQNGVLVTQWVDASAAERLGTMVFVRCATA